MYEKYKKKGFEIFAVSLDNDRSSWLNAIKTDSLKWIHVSDLMGQENTASLVYGVHAVPDNFLIDRKGILISRKLRGEELNEKLEEIMPVANISYIK